jgi:hypothetical protein
MKLNTFARQIAREDFAANWNTSARETLFLQCAIASGATSGTPDNPQFPSLARYKEVRGEFMQNYGEEHGWCEESGTENPAKMAWFRLNGSKLNPNYKPKAEKGISSKEKPLTLRKILDKAIAENNEPLAIATLAQIFAKKK